jgi:outer membrane receptor protein involved in Fe transport
MMNSAAYRFLTLIAVLSMVGSGMLHGQTQVSGGIAGNVTDSSGAVVADAAVEVTNVGTAVTDRTVTNRDGAYRFPSLIPGIYTLTITKQGFGEFKREATRIDAGTGYRVDAVLPIGTVKSAVTVTGETPILQTDSAEVSENIQSREIHNLPAFGRNITRLSLLAPGAFMATGQLDLHPENAGEDFNVHVNGTQTNNNAHILDGVDNTEVIQGYSLLVVPQDSVQELKLTTTNYDAEYGSVDGGIWQITTKSGSNAFHGSLFEYYRTSGFNAADHFSQPNGIPGNVWNQFGGSIGGPIKKDKLFFFSDFQGMRNHFFTSSLYTTPIDAFKIGDFTSIAGSDVIYDPATGNPDGTGRQQISCNGVLNKICPDRISQAASNLLALLPEPTIPGTPVNNYAVSRPATFNQNQVDGRVDYYVTPKTVVFGKYSYFDANFFTDNVFGPIAGGPALGGAVNSGNSYDHDQSAMVDYQHTFSPSLLQDARFAFSRIYIQELQLDTADTATKVGIPDINLGTIYTAGLPALQIDGPIGGFTMGDIGLPFFETETNFQFYSNWTKTWGNHAFKFGGEVAKFFGIRTDVSGRGNFESSQNITALNGPACALPPPAPPCGSGLAAFELGLTSNFGRDITLVQPQEKMWKRAFYGQDTWRMTPKLTVIAGLRWDYMSPIFTPTGQSVGNIDLNTNMVLLTNLAGKYAGVTTSKTEFSPRVGASYHLFPNTVLRGGFARSYFMNPYGAGFGTQGCCWPIKQSQADTAANTYAPLTFTLDQGPGLPATLPAYPSNGMLPFDGGPDGFSNLFPGVGPYPHSYDDSYNVTLEQILPHQFIFTIGYVGNHGRHLWDNIDVNAPIPGPGAFDPRRPYYANFGWTQEETQRNDQLPNYPELKNNFNSLQVHVEKRFQAGFYMLSNFTWAKGLDEGTFGPQNQFNFQSNYGNSDTTRPWASVSAVNWQLPFGRGQAYASNLSRPMELLAGGWTFSGIFNFQGGTYFTPTLANNASLNSTIALRPDRIGNGGVANPNRYQWFNTTDFVNVAQPYTYGNSGRNILLAPGYGEIDTTLSKTMVITERTRLELQWMVFNVANRINLGSPNASISPGIPTSDTGSGTITSIVDYRRRMQIGAHLTF